MHLGFHQFVWFLPSLLRGASWLGGYCLSNPMSRLGPSIPAELHWQFLWPSHGCRLLSILFDWWLRFSDYRHFYDLLMQAILAGVSRPRTLLRHWRRTILLSYNSPDSNLLCEERSGYCIRIYSIRIQYSRPDFSYPCAAALTQNWVQVDCTLHSLCRSVLFHHMSRSNVFEEEFHLLFKIQGPQSTDLP